VSFDKNLLDIACCPVTRQPLEIVPEALLFRINTLITDGRLKACDDSPVQQPLGEALMTRDRRIAYPVRDGIPVLLEEQGILLVQLDAV
jgi:uncharacterized protein YbaR (Trm112 family)